MSTNFLPKTWQELYKAALFETDKGKTAERIADAEQAIIARARSLFNSPCNPSGERNALDAAFYALNIMKFYGRGPQGNANVIPFAPIEPAVTKHADIGGRV